MVGNDDFCSTQKQDASKSTPESSSSHLGLKKVSFIKEAIEELRKSFNEKEETFDSDDDESECFFEEEEGLLLDDLRGQNMDDDFLQEGECMRGLFKAAVHSDSSTGGSLSFPKISSSLPHISPASVNTVSAPPISPLCFESSQTKETNSGNICTGTEMNNINVVAFHPMAHQEDIFSHDGQAGKSDSDQTRELASQPIVCHSTHRRRLCVQPLNLLANLLKSRLSWTRSRRGLKDMHLSSIALSMLPLRPSKK